ncbi:MAG TPA: outer membrane protein transport protein [Thermoanaerobaculia bacterium]|nr:outer membrane protein transport protein [Thermoanaerobaculia bacterium]
MKRNRLVRPLILLSVLTTAALPLFGAGFSFFEQGAKATGMAGAFAATADDPSAIFYNVAGIANIRETTAMAGGTIVTFTAEFESDPFSEFPGGDPDNPIPGVGIREFYEDHTFVLPNTYLVVPIGESMSFGLGVFSPFGLRTDWENGERFVGRFISQDASLKVASVQPCFAMRNASGTFAWGIGAEYRRAHVTLERNQLALNPFTGRIVDIAHVRLDSDWDSSWGWNAGILWSPAENWRVGLSHRSEMDIDFSGDADFQQIPTGNAQFDAIIGAQLPPDQAISTSIPFPSFTHFGIATDAIEDWTVEFDIIRMDWSVFEQLEVEFAQTPAANLSVEQNWKDVYSYRLGANHPVTDAWDVRLGVLYDENPQPDEAVGPLLPDSDRIGVSFGFGYHRGPWIIDVTEFILHFKDRSTRGRNQDNFNGTYETSANLISVNLGYRF